MNKVKKSLTKRILNYFQKNLFQILLGIFIIFIFTIPYFWMIGSSFKSMQEIFKYVYPVSWKTFIPIDFTWQNYKDLFDPLATGLPVGFDRFILNTLFTAVARVVMTLIVSSLIAYPLARMNFPGKNIIFILILSTMLVPFETVVLPTYMVTKQFHLDDTYLALILPWAASPMTVFLLRQFFKEIPHELDEAAIMDGASRFRIFVSIILPNSVPAMVTATLIIFLWGWDEFFWPLVVISDPAKQMVQVAIATFSTPEQIYWGRIFAACTITSIPILILFLLLQKYYIRSVVFSGIKG